MDRICPFLALSADHRTAIDGYDPDHACHARRPPEPLDGARQAELCLAESHRQCEFYLAYLAEHAAAVAAIPVPASDTHLARTRLIVQPDARRLGGTHPASIGTSPRRWLVAGGVAAMGVAAAATAFAGGFGGLVGAAPSASATPRGTTATPTSATATPMPTPSVTPAPSSPAPTPGPTASSESPRTPAATPERRTYVVQEGDTLSIVANRFGTSVAAIQRANGLGNSDVINVGQVLVIP